MNKKILLLLSVIVFVRIALMHTAARSLPDEYFYNYTLVALQQLKEGNIQQFIFELFSAVRPGYNIIAIIPASLQALLFLLVDLDPRSSLSLIIPQVCNGIANIYMLVIFHRILSLYISQRSIVNISVVTYALLLNSTIYTAHLFPYDYALCLVLWLFYHFLKMHKHHTIPGGKSVMVYGLVLSGTFLVYPGYYMVIPYFFISLAILCRSAGIKKVLASLTVFFAAFSASLLLFQALSLAGHTNYIAKCRRLSGTILQGSFEEGFSFIVKYFHEVEHLPFLVIAAGLLLYVVKELVRLKQNGRIAGNGLFMLFIYMFLIYIYNGFNIYFLHKQVNYGRLLHLYYPVIFLCFFAGINMLSKPYSVLSAVILLIAVSVNLSIFYYRAGASAYPLALAEKYSINIGASKMMYSHLTPIPYSSYDTSRQNKSFYLQNFSCFTDIAFINPIQRSFKDTLLLRPHFLNLKPYQYEGFDIQERKILDSHPIYTGIFRD